MPTPEISENIALAARLSYDSKMPIPSSQLLHPHKWSDVSLIFNVSFIIFMRMRAQLHVPLWTDFSFPYITYLFVVKYIQLNNTDCYVNYVHIGFGLN